MDTEQKIRFREELSHLVDEDRIKTNDRLEDSVYSLLELSFYPDDEPPKTYVIETVSGNKYKVTGFLRSEEGLVVADKRRWYPYNVVCNIPEGSFYMELNENTEAI